MKILKIKNGHNKIPNNRQERNKKTKKMWHIINTNYVKDCGTMSNVVKSKVGKIEKRQRTIMCKRSKKSQCNISTKFPTNEILPSSPILPEQRTLGGVRMELQRFYIFAKTELNMKKKYSPPILQKRRTLGGVRTGLQIFQISMLAKFLSSFQIKIQKKKFL